MYCPNCGRPIPDGATYCNRCGAVFDDYSRRSRDNAPAYNDDSGSFGWAVLGFFIPLVGLILYLVWKNEKPKSAKRAGQGALVCVILNLIILAIYFVFAFILIGSIAGDAANLAIAALL